MKNSSAEQNKLSADNYLGTVSSRFSLLNVSGSAIEWVREDSSNLIKSTVEDVSSQADGTNSMFELSNKNLVGFKLFDKTVQELSSKDVSAVSVYVDAEKASVFEIDAKNGLLTLNSSPPSGSLVKASYNWLNCAPVGVYGIEIVSPTTFMVDPLIYKEPFSVNVPSAKLSKIYFHEALGPSVFDDIQLFVDTNLLSSSYYTIDEPNRCIKFNQKPSGTVLEVFSGPTQLTAGLDYFIAKRRQSELLKRKTSGVEKVLDLSKTSPILGTVEVWLDNNKIVNERDDSSDPFSADKITFTLVDLYKVTFSKSLPPSLRVTASYYYFDLEERTSVPLSELFDGSLRILLPDAGIIPKSVDVWIKKDLVNHDQFTFDAETNELVLYTNPLDNAELRVSYYYALDSEGPYTFEPYQANNTAIAGCVMSFAKQADVGGRQLIFVSKEPEPTAEEFGGKFRVTFSLDVLALDPIQQEEITDLAAMYLLALKEKFDSEGLILEEVSIQGEAEEPYDENTTDQYYMATIGVTFLTDWHIRKAIPIKIRDAQIRLVTSTYLKEVDLDLFVSPSLYPVIDSPVIKSERIF